MAASLPERRFGWLDMWVPEDEDPRADGGWVNSEKGVLLGQLTDRRLTLKMNCRDSMRPRWRPHPAPI